VKEKVGYAGAHYRVKVAKGRAKDHLCEECGKPAEEWAYMNGDPEELTELRRPKGIPRLVAYSVHPEYYRPLCKPCHARADAGTSK
jgi:hypothetical protein